jgi:DNA-binding NtrC family response regulator
VQVTKQRSGQRKPLRVLVVQEDEQLGESLRDVLHERGEIVQWVTSQRDAVAACSQPFDWLVLDVTLSDGSGVALAELSARMRPAPCILAISSGADARDAFRMAQLGARGFLQKPFAIGEFTRMLDQLVDNVPEFLPHLVAVVGHTGFREVLDRVRRSMAEQALAMAAGNKTGAARLLGITRQAVQQLIRDLDLSDGTQRPVFEAELMTGELAKAEPRAEVAGVRRCH